MLETPAELRDLQRLLDDSAAAAGVHPRSILTPERRLNARELCDRLRHLRSRPGVSATHLPGEALAVTVHGRAELFKLSDPAGSALRQAMLDHYLPLQGPSSQEWLDNLDALGARIHADRIFTFQLAPKPGS